MAPIRPVVASVTAWVAGAAAAVSVGLVALSLIGSGIADQPVQPLAPHALDQGASQPTTASATASPGASASSTPPSTTGTAADKTVTSRGGTVVARCRSGGAYLVGWSPAPGYRAEDVVRGPAETAQVKFEGLGREIKITVRCVDGAVRPKVEDEAHE